MGGGVVEGGVIVGRGVLWVVGEEGCIVWGFVVGGGRIVVVWVVVMGGE